MEYRTAKITDVKPYEINNKIHTTEEIERLARSLDEFGWTQPICVDENLVVLAGHRRLLAAQSRGMTEVPIVIMPDMPEDKKRSYRMIDNKLSAYPHWDYENINQEMFYLQSQDVKIVDELLKDFLRNQDFKPNITPSQATATISAEALAEKERQLREKYQGSDVKLEVCCPECGHIFGLDQK